MGRAEPSSAAHEDPTCGRWRMGNRQGLCAGLEEGAWHQALRESAFAVSSWIRRRCNESEGALPSQCRSS
eukprot:11111448-Lingulodinium_polyedra.AAC.1